MARRHQQIDPQEEQLTRLLQLAQFASTASQPQLEQDQLDQRDQHQRLAAAIQLMGLQQEGQNQQEQRRLQERGIEEVAKSREETTKANVMDTLISHLSQRGDVPLSVIGDALKQGGHSELADALTTAHSADVQARAAKLLPALIATHAQGDKPYQALLGSISGDPDLMAALQPHLPSAATTTTAPDSSLGTKLGSTLRSVGSFDPLAMLAKVGQAGYNVGQKNAQDFWASLLNKQQPQPTQ